MSDPPAGANPPRSHSAWLETAREYLDETTDEEITAFFQAMHYDTGLTFVLSDTDASSTIATEQQYDLLAAHLNALAAATGTTVEGVAAQAIKTSRALSKDGMWSELAVTQSQPGEPELCLGCGRPNGADAADTSFDRVDTQTWKCTACGSTTTTPSNGSTDEQGEYFGG